ncbi:MAG TPA: hypothetical protein ENH91_11380 [Leeuwenhoekiella sp.]|nr:hypothetical protein [Leeuwenhoekiella sp.]
MQYKARKGLVIRLLLLLVLVLPVIMYVLDRSTFDKKPILLLPLLIPISLMLWVYFDTSYRIKNKRFYYRCGFLKGDFSITDIKEIGHRKNVRSGIKPALARNGLLIKYKAHEEIYVAPVNNQQMIDDLLKINKSIRVAS